VEIEILPAAGGVAGRPPEFRPRPVPAPPVIAAGPNGVPDLAEGDLGGRAAELVQRLRRLTIAGDEDRSPPAEASPDAPPGPAPALAVPAAETAHEAPERAAAVAAPPAPATESGLKAAATIAVRGQERLAHLYGARCVSRGVLFVQPGGDERTIYVAGDFNGWSPFAHPLRRNPQLGVREALVRIPPGRWRYRLLIDGRWRCDPYNAEKETDGRGNEASILVVPEAKAQP
jgi:hypothetical protein